MRAAMRAALCAAVVCSAWLPLPARAAETWTEVRSPNFRVVTNGSARDAREVASNFERLAAVLRRTSNISTRGDVPLTILAVKSKRDLTSVIGVDRDDIAGIFAPGHDANVVIIRLDLDRDSRYEVAYHEYMHLLVHQTMGLLPLWLNEGLAEFYSHALLETDKIYLGTPAPYHLAALEERTPLPLETLLTVDHDSAHYTEGNRATIFYAQSWALTHFLMLGDGGVHRPQLVTLLETLDKGVPPADAARRAFGDLTVFERQFRAYLARFSFPALTDTVPIDQSSKTMQARALPPAEALAVLATVNAVAGKADTATALASQAVAADAAVSDAWVAKARAARRAGDPAAAEVSLARAVSLGSTDPLAHYGWAELRLQTVPDDHPLDDVAAALERSLALKEDLARAMSLLGYVRARQAPGDARGFEFTKQAVLLEPGNARHFLMMAAVLYMRRDHVAVEAALGRAALVARGEKERERVAEARRTLVAR